jgi:winged helix DNA-binding protein
VDADQVLAFRLARSGLAVREAAGFAEAAACPASDFARDAALLALAARMEAVSREAYDEAVDAGEVVVAHVVRGAIHALAPGDLALFGRALLARDDAELAVQLGRQVRGLLSEHGIGAAEALDEVASATEAALDGGAALGKDQLHEALRRQVPEALMPWCKGCGSFHVAPMLWRYATVRAGVRLDARRCYVQGRPGRAPQAAQAVRRFLGAYGPARPADFAEWAGVAKPHGKRLWDEVAGELEEVSIGGEARWLLAEDVPALESPPAAEGVRLIPAGDPYLQLPNRPLLAPDATLRKRLFRPVASPGAVLVDGRLAGLWRAKARGKRTELTVEGLERIARARLEPEVERIAALRGSAGLALVVS